MLSFVSSGFLLLVSLLILTLYGSVVGSFVEGFRPLGFTPAINNDALADGNTTMPTFEPIPGSKVIRMHGK